MTRDSGLTVVETLVAIVLLGIISVAVISFLPIIGQTTTDADLDARQTQRAISIFEKIGSDWTNEVPWRDEFLFVAGVEVPVQTFVANEMAAVGLDCSVAVAGATSVTKRVTITCEGDESLPESRLSAEYGMPSA